MSLYSLRRQQKAAQMAATKPIYPGLGLPLRANSYETQCPIGAHVKCEGATSDVLPVRELAMLSIMESLTDKPDWHVKVYDDEIVETWRTEALAIPNHHWWDLATSAKQQHWEADGYVNLIAESTSGWIKVPENIMSATTFNCVSVSK